MYLVQSNFILSILLQFLVFEFLLFFPKFIFSQNLLRKQKELRDLRKNQNVWTIFAKIFAKISRRFCEDFRENDKRKFKLISFQPQKEKKRRKEGCD